LHSAEALAFSERSVEQLGTNLHMPLFQYVRTCGTMLPPGAGAQMTCVLITIDTELSPAAHGRGTSIADNFDTAILGRVSDGEWGIAYQARRLKDNRLKGVFFVEALSASVVGIEFLKRTIDPILSHDSEVQLHVHSEWLPWFKNDPLNGKRGQNIADFNFHEQKLLLELGIENLIKAGAPRPSAFRAGNYGANNDTLRALADVGIAYDTSYNLRYLGGSCAIRTNAPVMKPTFLEGVIEVPIAAFEDFPGHIRPAQLCAISSSEMRAVIAQSIDQSTQTAVIVSHSFELLNSTRRRSNRILVRRFEEMCEMLASMKSSAPTRGFEELDRDALVRDSQRVVRLRSNPLRTASRVLEQAFGTIRYG
jgi:hypothetical protein